MAPLAAGKRGAREIADGRPTTLLRRYSIAADVLRNYNAEGCAPRSAHRGLPRPRP